MATSKKYQKYTKEQLTELATLTTRKQLKRFARLSKHTYSSVYMYWRKLTGRKLADFDASVIGAPRKHKTTTTRNNVTTVTNRKTSTNSVSVPITSMQVVVDKSGKPTLVITW